MFVRKIVLTTMTLSLLSLSSLSVASSCGKGNWVDTGTKGPWGWTWHYNAEKTTGNAQGAKYVCSHFFGDTKNCNNLPVTVHNATYNSCSYNTGIYTLQGLALGYNVITDCQVC